MTQNLKVAPQITIALSEATRQFLESELAEGHFTSPGDYIEALLQELQDEKERERIDARLLKSLESGEPIKVTPEYWEERRRRLLAKFSLSNTP